MTMDEVLRENHSAVEELASAGEQCGDAWLTPRAPGKWSPSQLVEHVARALEESAKALTGQPTRFPKFPGPLRALVRVAFFQPVLRKGKFGNARTNKAMDPQSGPTTPAEGRARLQEAMDAYDEACRNHVRTSATFNHTIFGSVSVVDYARFQAMHTRHHRKQLPT